jgi:cytochrome oxidase Cu insertion factor (SCO1/SenC/PrrC family)
MPGMGRPLQTSNSLIVSEFHHALLDQLLIVAAIAMAAAVGFNVVRTVQYRRLRQHGLVSFPSSTRLGPPEPLARRVLRIGFGCLWILDGLLQIQSSMPLGLPSQVVQPAASSSPSWVQHLVNSGVTIWADHPIAAAAATVWIQIGLGVWLLVAPRGRWSRAGGAASAAWALIVWMFGEAFGGIFAPGLTWLFGAPGAVIFYGVAGVLIALPERAFVTPRLGRIVVRAGGSFLLVMAILQAWPGRGYWQGRHGTLSTMVAEMAKTPQPGFLSSWVNSFSSFDSAHGWGVNLFVVIALACIGCAFLTARPRLVLGGLVVLVLLALADWVLVEDLGVLGGTGTDPNSMLPMALLFVSGFLAMTRVPGAADVRELDTIAPIASTPLDAVSDGATDSSPERPWWRGATLSYLARATAALAALAIVVLGSGPMAVAAVSSSTDPVVSEALDGTPNAIDTPAPPFSLVDQHGNAVTLASLRGHVVALTFLDPVCTTDCPLIAQEFRNADARLGSLSTRVDFIAIVANPIYRSVSFTDAFDRQEGLTRVANWYFLTGPLASLRQVWNSYGVPVETIPYGAMVAHSDLAFVIDSHGRERVELIDDPGPNQTTASSFASLLVDQIDHLLS